MVDQGCVEIRGLGDATHTQRAMDRIVVGGGPTDGIAGEVDVRVGPDIEIGGGAPQRGAILPGHEHRTRLDGDVDLALLRMIQVDGQRAIPGLEATVGRKYAEIFDCKSDVADRLVDHIAIPRIGAAS